MQPVVYGLRNVCHFYSYKSYRIFADRSQKQIIK